MKNLILLLAIFPTTLLAQNKLYINLNSHNEINLEPYDTDPAHFSKTKDSIISILDIVTTRQAKWNFQSCSRFALGVIQNDFGPINPNDIFDILQNSGYVELDPRQKTGSGYTYNIADVAHLIDSCGATSSTTAGGFVYFPFASEDWTPYLDTIYGTNFGNPWKAEIMWGAGSIPPHTNDANNYGVWMPSGETDSISFYTHDPFSTVWLQGNGCSHVIYDTTTNPLWIVNDLRKIATNINTGVYPTNKFYCSSLMINCKHFDSPGFALKVQQVIDSINVLVIEGKVEWKFISEKQTAFDAWALSSGIAHSQLSCEEGELLTISMEKNLSNLLTVYPNPSTGIFHVISDINDIKISVVNIAGETIMHNQQFKKGTNKIDLSSQAKGVYLVKAENINGTCVKKIIID